MAFAPNSNYLISIGCDEENAIALWNVKEERVMASARNDNNPCVNKLVVNHQLSEQAPAIEFLTVGNQGSLTFWKADLEDENLMRCDAEVPSQEVGETNFVTACYTQSLNAPYQTCLVMIGTNDGSLLAYNPKEKSYVDGGKKV